MVTNTGETATAISVPKATEGVTRWSPLEELSDLRHRMEDLFARAFGYTPLSRLLPSEPYTFDPPMDVFEKENAFDAFVSIPGFTPEMINVHASSDTLTVEGERKALYEEKATPQRHGWVTGAGSFRISYTLPAEIEPNKIKATFKEGILHLEIPKSEKAAAKMVKVKIQPA